MEIGTDYTLDTERANGYTMVPKREFNPEISAVSNFVLDMVDFRDRIRPLARDMTLYDVTKKHQRYSYEDHKKAR